MSSVSRVLLLVAVLGVVVSLPASADGPKGTTVWDVVQVSAVHETLEEAIECTGLEGVLAGNGQRTLFAPTDAAFAGFGLNPGNICSAFTVDELTAILANHVTKGRRNSTSVVGSKQIRMISKSNQPVEVQVNPTTEVLVGGAKLDLNNLDVGSRGSFIAIGNGLIHFVGEGIVGLGLPE